MVNVSSISAMTGPGSSIAYVASKAALNTKTLSLARALAPEVRVNAVCPALFDSRWWADGLGEVPYQKLWERFIEDVPLKAAATAESIADTIVWLLESAGYITGETLMIDSGCICLAFNPKAGLPLFCFVVWDSWRTSNFISMFTGISRLEK